MKKGVLIGIIVTAIVIGIASIVSYSNTNPFNPTIEENPVSESEETPVGETEATSGREFTIELGETITITANP